MSFAAEMLGLVVFALLGGAVVVWFKLWKLWRSGSELLDHLPRSPVAWNVADLIIVAGAYLGSHSIFGQWYEWPHDDIANLLNVVTFSNLATMAFVLIYLTLRGASWNDLGLSLTDWRRDLVYGLAGLAAIAPVVFAIQALLSLVFQGEHPVVVLLKQSRDPLTILFTTLTVAVVAPLVEELLFRVILQGWLESAFADSRGYKLPTDGTPASETHAWVSPSDLATEPRSYWAILISSTIFAVIHLRSDSADPIPLFLLACVLGYLYQQTHRIWSCVVLHAGLNATSLLAVLAAPIKPE